jgi:ParB-like chromosome segregation protein Spo0J
VINYELIQGTRRYRASSLAGCPTTWASVVNVSDSGRQQLLMAATLRSTIEQTEKACNAVRADLAHARENGKRLGRPRTAARKAGHVRDRYRAGTNKAEIACRYKNSN